MYCITPFLCNNNSIHSPCKYEHMNNQYTRISILGCGWYGLPLAKTLAGEGFSVKGSTTSPDKIPAIRQTGAAPCIINITATEENFDQEFFDCDILLISIPPKRSSTELHVFLDKIRRIAEIAAAAPVAQVIFISSTSVYGDHNQVVDESSSPVPDTDSGKVMLEAERLLQENTAFKTTVIRFGGLIGPDRNPGRFFAGKSGIANGQSPVNLIHQSDCIGITMSIIQKQAFGEIYNACAPEHPTRAQFYTAAAKSTGLALPEFTDELQNWKVVSSAKVQTTLGYNFKYSLNSIVIQ
jgi:nucleoside-diphosphate-sugar epimerase